MKVKISLFTFMIVPLRYFDEEFSMVYPNAKMPFLAFLVSCKKILAVICERIEFGGDVFTCPDNAIRIGLSQYDQF